MTKSNYPSTTFRIPADSPCGIELGKLLRAMEVVENKASEKALELGAEQYEPNRFAAAGGIGMLYFSSEPKEDVYAVVGTLIDGEEKQILYAAFPNKETEQGRCIYESLVQLPIVRAESVLDVIGLKANRTKNGVVMPNFHLVEDEGKKWYCLNTRGAKFLEGRQDKLYQEGMERISARKHKAYIKQLLSNPS